MSKSRTTATSLRRISSHLLKGVPLSLLVLCVFSSCTYRQNDLAADVNPRDWEADRPVEVRYNNEGEGVPVNISVFVEHKRTPNALPDSLSLAIDIYSPDSLHYRENFLVWLEGGESRSSRAWRETTVQYRTNVTFPLAGEYTFRFSHDHPGEVEGVRGIGLIIEYNQ